MAIQTINGGSGSNIDVDSGCGGSGGIDGGSGAEVLMVAVVAQELVTAVMATHNRSGCRPAGHTYGKKEKFSKRVRKYTVSKRIELESPGCSAFKDHQNVFQG